MTWFAASLWNWYQNCALHHSLLDHELSELIVDDGAFAKKPDARSQVYQGGSPTVTGETSTSSGMLINSKQRVLISEVEMEGS